MHQFLCDHQFINLKGIIMTAEILLYLLVMMDFNIVEKSVASTHLDIHNGLYKGHSSSYKNDAGHTRKSHHQTKQETKQGAKLQGLKRMKEKSFRAPTITKIFNVLSYGAIGDGEADDTKAFLATWQEACQVECAIFQVPQYFTFVIRPINFVGPCATNIIFKIDGDIVAPNNPSKWGAATKGLVQWITFSKLHNMLVIGRGTINGNGAPWWSAFSSSKGTKYSARPTALRFYKSSNITVQNIHIRNSPQAHLKFDSCVGITVKNISINAPANSPNTDGIHLQNTQNVEIHDSHISNGDDCISIQTGSANLDIHHIVCEAGHGISLGGLGRDQTQACVSNVSVHDVTIKNSQNGLRIKTWQGGLGVVKGITYYNVMVENISNPIIIDQFYCGTTSSGHCKNMSSGVQVMDVTYHNIHGTYSKGRPVHFACSDTVPCTKIMIAQVELLPFRGFFMQVDKPFCWNSYGSSLMPTIPSFHVCLHPNSLAPKPSSTPLKSTSTSLDNTCITY